MSFAIVQTLAEHGPELAEHVRGFVDDEAQAMFGTGAREAIAQSIDGSLRCWTWMVNGQVGFIAGMSKRSFLDPTVCIWVSTTELVAQYPVAFIRACKAVLREIEATHPEIETWIDARAGVSLAWAQHFGFEMHPAEPFGVMGLPFHKFTKVQHGMA